MAELKLTDQNFDEEVTQKAGIVLVDFWAPWCGPCQMLGPIIAEIAEEVEGVSVGKLNVDENQMVASRYGVMSIPTVIVFKDGKIVQTLVGVRAKENYLSAIEAAK